MLRCKKKGQIFSTSFQIAERASNHGIGRHSSEEIHKIGCDDIQAISTFLGSKPYMLGEKPTLVSDSNWDKNYAALFHQICSIPIFRRGPDIVNIGYRFWSLAYLKDAMSKSRMLYNWHLKSKVPHGQSRLPCTGGHYDIPTHHSDGKR